MANIKSAIKKVRVSQRNYKINRLYKSTIKTIIKKYNLLLKTYRLNSEESKMKEIKTTLSLIYSKIDKAVKKNVFHKNKGARKKSRLSKSLSKVLIS